MKSLTYIGVPVILSALIMVAFLLVEEPDYQSVRAKCLARGYTSFITVREKDALIYYCVEMRAMERL